MGEAGIEEPAGEHLATPRRADRLTSSPGVHSPGSRRPESEHPDGVAADEDLRAGPADRRVQSQPELRR
jgi:hypothetical protein